MKRDNHWATESEPHVIPFSRTTVKLWGDEEAGYVNDWIFSSSDRIHQLIFSLPPGKGFRHSEHHRTVFGADQLYYVLKGTLVIANPERGEVVRVRAGEAVCFRKDTWHHGFNFGDEELRVLEYFAPPPRAGMSQDYARTRPYLTAGRYAKDEWLGKWPSGTEVRTETRTLTPIRESDVLWRIEGQERNILVGIMFSTENLTVGTIDLLPGRYSEPRSHGGDLSMYVLSGRLNVRLPDRPRPDDWLQVEAGDGFFAPLGVRYMLFNMTDAPVRAIFGVAPSYLSG